MMLREQMEGEAEDPSMKSKLKKANMAKKQVLMKKLQAVRMGAGDDIQASNELEGEVELDEADSLAAMAARREKRSCRIEKEKDSNEEVEQIDERLDSLAASRV